MSMQSTRSNRNQEKARKDMSMTTQQKKRLREAESSNSRADSCRNTGKIENEAAHQPCEAPVEVVAKNNEVDFPTYMQYFASLFATELHAIHTGDARDDVLRLCTDAVEHGFRTFPPPKGTQRCHAAGAHDPCASVQLPPRGERFLVSSILHEVESGTKSTEQPLHRKKLLPPAPLVFVREKLELRQDEKN